VNAQPFGQWAFVHPCAIEPDLLDRVPGLRPSGVFVLPPEFDETLQASGILGRVNARFGTLLDFYEEEDVSSAETLVFLSGALEELFIGQRLQTLVGDLASFLLESARHEQCLTFRL